MPKRKAVRPYVGDIKAKILEAEVELRSARGAITADGTNAAAIAVIQQGGGIAVGAIEMIQERSAALLKTRSTEVKLQREKIRRLRDEANELEAGLPKEEKDGS